MKRFLSIFLVILILGSFSVGAAAEVEYVIKFAWGNPLDPFATGTSAFAHLFKAELETLSQGRIKVDLYPAGQLGDFVSVVQQVRQGVIEMASPNVGHLGSLYSKVNIFDMPFTFSTYADAQRFYSSNHPILQQIREECLKETDIRILGFNTFGFRHFFSKGKPIRTPEDLKGMKIRASEAVAHVKLFEALGAKTVVIPWLELYTGLQTGVADGADQTLCLAVSSKMYEVQDYVSLTSHVMASSCIVISEKFYQSLPDDLKIALLKAFTLARTGYLGVYATLDAVALQDLKNYGMEIYIPTSEEIEMFKETGLPPVIKWFEEELGADFVNEYLEAAKTSQDEWQKELEDYIKK